MSANRVELPKVQARKSLVEPSPAWGRDAGGEVFIRCSCGVCMNLDREHAIDTEGNVNPSLHHAEPQCGWHVFARLLDWDGERPLIQ